MAAEDYHADFYDPPFEQDESDYSEKQRRKGMRQGLIMAEIWKPKDPQLLKSWVDAILVEASDKLNDWETKFIVDIQMRLDLGARLTQAQEDKLEQIYADKTS